MSNNDDKEWEDYVKSVKPIKKDGGLYFKKNFNKQISCQKSQIKENDNILEIEIVRDDIKRELTIDKNLLRNIKRGKIKINSILDLHGLRVQEAKSMVYKFIKENYETNSRLLLIITGKGKRLGVEDGWRGKGVLKDLLPNWLKSILLSRFIIWYGIAPSQQGGSGAYLIYLKKVIK